MHDKLRGVRRDIMPHRELMTLTLGAISKGLQHVVHTSCVNEKALIMRRQLTAAGAAAMSSDTKGPTVNWPHFHSKHQYLAAGGAMHNSPPKTRTFIPAGP